MDKMISEFVKDLTLERKMAPNSVNAYEKDMAEFKHFLEERAINNVSEINNTEVVAYLLKLRNDGKASATVNRKAASLRAFCNFMFSKGYIASNPAMHIKSPKISRKPIEYLTLAEIEKLLEQPDLSMKGIRDRAILELLYATGIRVTELTEMNLSDVNVRIGFVTCSGEHGKARIIPLGRPARAAVEVYIFDARKKLIHNETSKEQALFVNYAGERMTRQGLWKIIRHYAEKAGVEHKITPQILRNSFAVHMIQNGADLKSIQELLGHEDITTTQIYLEATKSKIKEVYDRSHPRA
jgi:integrase/recombinase XerD